MWIYYSAFQIHCCISWMYESHRNATQQKGMQHTIVTLWGTLPSRWIAMPLAIIQTCYECRLSWHSCQMFPAIHFSPERERDRQKKMILEMTSPTKLLGFHSKAWEMENFSPIFKVARQKSPLTDRSTCTQPNTKTRNSGMWGNFLTNCWTVAQARLLVGFKVKSRWLFSHADQNLGSQNTKLS